MDSIKTPSKDANTVIIGVDNSKRRLIVMIYLVIFMMAFGLYPSMFGTLQPTIIEHYKLDLQQASLFHVVQSMGIVVSMTVTALIVDRLNKNRLIGIMVSMMGLSLILMGTAPVFLILLAVWTLVGITLSIANNTCSSHVSDLYGPERSKYMAILHSFYGMGSLLGPTYAAFMLRKGNGWNGSYAFFGITILIVAVFFLMTLFIAKEPVSLVSNIDKNGNRKKMSFGILLGNKNMLVLGIISICIAGLQLLPSWLPTYLTRQDPVYYTMDRYSVIMTLFYVGMVLSRLSYSYISKWLPPHKYIRISSLASAALLIPALLFQAGWLWYATLLALGLISGALYTAQHALACQEYPEYSASAMSVITLFTAVGSILINSLIGYIADLGYFTAAMFVPVLAIGAASVIITAAYTPAKERI